MIEMTAKMMPADSPRRLAGDEIWAVAGAEYLRMLDLLRSLQGGDWLRSTDCTAWDVRAMVGHLVGSVEALANPIEMVHQFRVGAGLVKRRQADGDMLVDGANTVQVRDRAEFSTTKLISRYERAIPRAMGWRRRFRWTPGSMRDVGGRFRLRELYEVIYTRDTWIHRVDIARATGRAMVLTADHDGRIVADAVTAWANKHGRPYDLRLSGPAGGRFVTRTAAAPVTIDAVEFLRALSGRGTRDEILGTRIVF
ncbi:MAG: maleylpyruvate isomerase family mycothiol-dependent enzyme [Candidatus Dormibacteraeota bacterium]|nr:maleylpyruvate isomerase family mycothiol-dependent enzyme [Candidatus Dormibacteraeota bacterium]